VAVSTVWFLSEGTCSLCPLLEAGASLLVPGPSLTFLGFYSVVESDRKKKASELFRGRDALTLASHFPG
jgi:hypothetical protein